MGLADKGKGNLPGIIDLKFEIKFLVFPFSNEGAEVFLIS